MIFILMRLAGSSTEVPPTRLAVVTGCNRGLGRAVALRLARDEGFQVAAVCRRLRDAKRTVQALGGRTCAVPIQLDIGAGPAAIRKAAGEIEAWVGTSSSKLALVVNNAGISSGCWDEEAWSMSRAINYDGPVAFTEALLPALSDNASVVMVGSGLGDVSVLSPQYRRLLRRAPCIDDLDKIASRPLSLLGTEATWVGPYGLSKALLHRATQILALDDRFVGRGIKVNAVCPGWVSTDMGGQQAPITVEEGAAHILGRAFLRADQAWGSAQQGEDMGGAGSSDSSRCNASNRSSATTGTFVCYCYKNDDPEHTKAWEEKHGKWWDGNGDDSSQVWQCEVEGHCNKSMAIDISETEKPEKKRERDLTADKTGTGVGAKSKKNKSGS